MSGPWSLEEFAALTRIPVEEVQEYRNAGLIGHRQQSFDTGDVLAATLVRRFVAAGGRTANAATAFAGADDPIARRLFQAETYTVEEAARRLGQSADELRAIGVASGFAGVLFDDADIAALDVATVLTRAGLPIEALFEGARVYADGLRRIADAGVEMLDRHVCQPMLADSVDAAEVAERTGPLFDEFAQRSIPLLAHLYVDYLVRARGDHLVRLLESGGAETPHGTRVATIVFADLSLFSSLAELEGDEAAVALVDRTDIAVREMALRNRGRLVKQIGDEFMLIFARATDGVAFALDLRRYFLENEPNAAARIGMHHGSVIHRLGDFYGRAVNIAARIVSMATPNSILVTEPIAAAAREVGSARAEEIGVRTLRGMDDPLTVYRLVG